MRLLAIESSCDETAAAVVDDGRHVVASVVASQIAAHRAFGGVVPELASRLHCEAISGVAAEALRQAGCTLAAMDALAVTHAPGLVGALLVGVNFAKGLAFATHKPLVAVHHLWAHVAATYLSHPHLQPPFVALIASGGHTHIVHVQGFCQCQVLGRTQDDAAGEALDKTARMLGLPYPGGLHLQTLGLGGNPAAFAFPRPKAPGYDYSFSGLKTAALRVLQAQGLCRLAAPGEPDLPSFAPQEAEQRRDFAASFQAAVADYLCGNVLRAAQHTQLRTVVLAGGVAANTVLRAELQHRCDTAGLQLCVPPIAYCGDNAAMVGAQGFFALQAGHRADASLNAAPGLAMDACFA